MSELHLAAAQATSTRGDVAANVAHHVALAARAADHGARVLVFPELSLTGYELDLAESLAFALDDPRLDPLRKAADEHAVTLLPGGPVRIEGRLHIGAFVIEPGGALRLYTKHHPVDEENEIFAAGDLDPRIEVGGRRAALAICADTSEPAHAEAAARSGATLYLAGVFAPTDSYDRNAERLAGYASQHGMAVVMANSGADCTAYETPGGSAIWSEAGDRVAHLAGPGAGLVLAHFDDAYEDDGWEGEAIRLAH